MKQPDPHDKLIQALDRQQITEDAFAKMMKEEMEATVEKPFLDKSTGKVVYSKPLVAWDVRQRARMDGQRLRGLYPLEEQRFRAELELQYSPEQLKVLRRAAEIAAEMERKRLLEHKGGDGEET